MVEVTIQDVETKETRNGGSRYVIKTDQGIFNTKDQRLALTFRDNVGARARFEFNTTDFGGRDWHWIYENSVQIVGETTGQPQAVQSTPSSPQAVATPLPSSAPAPAPAPQAQSRSSEFRTPEQIMRGIAVEAIGGYLQYLEDVTIETTKAMLDTLTQYQVDGTFPTTAPQTDSVPY